MHNEKLSQGFEFYGEGYLARFFITITRWQMVKSGLSVFKGKRILLLQGPMGPFFRHLQKDLIQAGAQVFKVNFNGGDWLFYPENTFNFRGRPEAWPAYFAALVEQLHVDVIMLFGDCRLIHREAHNIAHSLGLEIGVFEEGYIRPNFITLERFGVNGHSTMPRLAAFYLNDNTPRVDEPLQLGNTYWYAVLWSVLYYFVAGLLKPVFPYYRHHRRLSWFEFFPWSRSLWRKCYYAFKERGMLRLLIGKFSGRYFLVPLQVHNDAQIVTHSEFDTVECFINKVIESFAGHAQQDNILVIKHHPMDRGYFDYAALIKTRTKQFGLEGRCFYIHDQHLPTLLKRTCGVIVVNSTVGLSALLYGAPVKTCGKALYDLEGLTFQGHSNQFWDEAVHARPNAKLLSNFINYLIVNSQVNGNFYKRLPVVASSTGLLWTGQVQKLL